MLMSLALRTAATLALIDKTWAGREVHDTAGTITTEGRGPQAVIVVETVQTGERQVDIVLTLSLMAKGTMLAIDEHTGAPYVAADDWQVMTDGRSSEAVLDVLEQQAVYALANDMLVRKMQGDLAVVRRGDAQGAQRVLILSCANTDVPRSVWGALLDAVETSPHVPSGLRELIATALVVGMPASPCTPPDWSGLGLEASPPPDDVAPGAAAQQAA